MTPEQRKAEIERLSQRKFDLIQDMEIHSDAIGMLCRCSSCMQDKVALHRVIYELAALEAESGHEPKEKQDGEA